jgi:lactate dehydrogenase-like 2-hydroxyacid dehydrogenase
MSKPKILQMGGYPAWDQTALDAAFDMQRYDQAADKAGFLASVGPEVRGIATNGGLGASSAVIAACPQLEIISIYGVGYDAVDMDQCRARGIRVTNTPDVLTGDCADLAVGMVLALSRGIVAAEAWARSGDWAKKGGFALQRRVWGKRVGILGLGRIGMDVAERMVGFGCEIGYSSRTQKAVDWAYHPDPVALAAWSDILILTALASAETRHIVNAPVLAALGPEGLFVNISRAANVDEAALIDALASGKIAGAGLDVFEGEPNFDPRLLEMPNLLLQPHHASGTIETRKAMGKLTVDNLKAHFAGAPLLTPLI